VREVAEHVLRDLPERSGRDLILTRSRRTALAATAFAGLDATCVFEAGDVCGLVVEVGDPRAATARFFVQHTGGHMTSRQAEDWLCEARILEASSPEQAAGLRAEEQIASVLREAYGAGAADDVFLHNSGMNALYSAIAGLQWVQRARGRYVWVQLGWNFFDTVALLRKGIVDCEHVALPGPFSMEALEALVSERGSELAGIVAEVPSNPLIQTPDVEALRRAADRAGCAVVLDVTIGTPYNVSVLRMADVVCESLTKYATGSADVLMGASIINGESRFSEALRASFANFRETPYPRDAARVAHRIAGYRERIQVVNANAMEAARFFAESRLVRRVYWAYEKSSAANYERIQHESCSPGGLLMLDLTVQVERVYDGLRCAKGPSFGWDGTMAVPQVFIAHFDLLQTAQGRSELAAHGLHRDMLRVSIGMEPATNILSTFEAAFREAD
jgi:cystathionine beta-lyase/cystathionine gamma-synthase